VALIHAALLSAYLGCVLDIADGRPVTLESFFKPRNLFNVFLANIVVGVIIVIGTLLCVIPGVIAAVMLMFTAVAVVDRNLSPFDALRTSFELSKARFGDALLLFVVMVATAFVGVLALGIGLLVALPVVALILAYTYRTFSGGTVVPADAQPLPEG
jgi:uncharacterized membrane protein